MGGGLEAPPRHVIHDKTSCLFPSVIIHHQKPKPPNDTKSLENAQTGHDFPPTVIASPNVRFDAASFLTKNSVLNIVEQLGPNTKNLDRGKE